MEDFAIDKSIFNYYLPKHLIAQEPLKERASSRLLVMDKKTGKIIHDMFENIGNYLNAGDCLVLNDTRVIPARLMGVKETGAVIEALLLKNVGEAEWEALTRPAKRLKLGDRIVFGEGLLTGRITAVYDNGIRHIKMEYEGIFQEVLDMLGEMPLPPYITKTLEDKSRYQTVYAKNPGSAAAPTAGLHFTERLLASLSEKGVKTAKITLHVGLGTFRPVKERNVLEHKMHSEYFNIDGENADIINGAKKAGGRIVCVGTTAVRTLETVASKSGELCPAHGETDIFIYPGCAFKVTDAIITNFHLPESTLIALAAAFAGTENVMRAYDEAVERQYRFFSFGDCCLFL